MSHEQQQQQRERETAVAVRSTDHHHAADAAVSQTECMRTSESRALGRVDFATAGGEMAASGVDEVVEATGCHARRVVAECATQQLVGASTARSVDDEEELLSDALAGGLTPSGTDCQSDVGDERIAVVGEGESTGSGSRDGQGRKEGVGGSSSHGGRAWRDSWQGADAKGRLRREGSEDGGSEGSKKEQTKCERGPAARGDTVAAHQDAAARGMCEGRAEDMGHRERPGRLTGSAGRPSPIG